MSKGNGYGSGQVNTLSTGTKSIKVYLGRDPETGKRITRRVSAKTLKEARALATKLKEEYRPSKKSSDVLLSDYLATWIDEHNIRKGGKLKEGTLKKYRETFRLVNKFMGKIKLKDLGEWDLDRLILSKDYSPQHKHRAYRYLKWALEDAVKTHGIRSPYSDHLGFENPGKARDEQAYLTREQVREFLLECNTDDTVELRMKYLVKVLSSTGCRIGEALNLRTTDIDWENNLIHMNGSLVRSELGGDDRFSVSDGGRTKNHKRTIYMSEELARTVQEQFLLQTNRRHKVEARIKLLQDKGVDITEEMKWEDKNLLFSTERGGYLDYHNVNRDLKNVGKRTSIPRLDLHFHAFRHSSTTWAMNDVDNKDVNLVQLASRQGHSPDLLLRDYAHQDGIKQAGLAKISDELLAL